MTHPVKGIDHVFLLVHALDSSAAAWQRLGFAVSPRGLHSAEMGTGNYTIMFSNDYLELLGVVTQTPRSDLQRDRLVRQGEGLHAIACRIDNAQQAKAELGALGIATGDVGVFERPVTLSTGEAGVAAFETVAYSDQEVPQGIVFMCQHKTRDTVWLPELITHANGTEGIGAVLVVSDSAEATAHGFARLFADGAVRMAGAGTWQIETGPDSAAIIVHEPQAARALYGPDIVEQTPAGAFAGLRLRVKDLGQLRQVLEARDVSYRAHDNQIIVSAAQANGTVLVFSED
jgi:hypothetical protein